MRNTRGKRRPAVAVLAGILAAVLVVGLAPAAPSFAAGSSSSSSSEITLYAHWARTKVNYLDAAGVQQVLEEYQLLSEALSGDNTALAAGWYVVNEGASAFVAPSRITVSGDVHLVLRNGVTFRADGGIQVATGAKLTIYRQPEVAGSSVGELQATATATASGAAGIGGNSGEGCGNVTVLGGKVTATGNGGGAGIGGGAGGAGGTVTISGGSVEATGGSSGGAGIGGGSNGAGGTASISGGEVVATGNGGGAGIGSGTEAGAGSGGSVSLDWTEASFASTSVTASSYTGEVTFVRPYVLQEVGSASTPACYGHSSLESNIDGATIVPGVHFLSDVPLKEGRWYDRFTAGSSSLEIPLEIPKNSSFTALVEMEGAGGLRSLANKANSKIKITGLSVEFSSALPAKTALTLTAAPKSLDGGYAHYFYTVPDGGASIIPLADFKSMSDRTTQFACSEGDGAYLVSADFKGVSTSDVPADIGVNILASYTDWKGGTGSSAVVTKSVDKCTLVELGEIVANDSSVTVKRQPSESGLLSSQKVYLVGVISGTLAGGGNGGGGSAPVAMQGTTATCGETPGKWIGPDTVAFPLGDYGSIDSGKVGSPMRFVFDKSALGSGTFEVRWTLCTGPELAGPETWNIRANAVSNDAVSSFTGETADLPSLTATMAPEKTRVKVSEIQGANLVLSFNVESNRSFTAEVCKQDRLGAFVPLKGSTHEPQHFSYSDGTSSYSVSLGLPKEPGVYRVCFSMDESADSGNVYKTIVVEE